MTTVVLDSQYLPCLEYFVCLLKYDNVCIDIYENYQKQSYRNRCYIRGANEVQTLSIPVIKGNSKQIFKDVKIDYTQSWVNTHWRTITSAYGKAPFFEYYADLLHPVLYRKNAFLCDLNSELLTMCLKLLGIPVKITCSDKYIDMTEESNKNIFTDLKSVIHPKKGYMNNGLYQPKAYLQNFGSDFVPNLSILDLLFCEGNNSSFILSESLHP